MEWDAREYLADFFSTGARQELTKEQTGELVKALTSQSSFVTPDQLGLLIESLPLLEGPTLEYLIYIATQEGRLSIKLVVAILAHPGLTDKVLADLAFATFERDARIRGALEQHPLGAALLALLGGDLNRPKLLKYGNRLKDAPGAVEVYEVLSKQSARKLVKGTSEREQESGWAFFGIPEEEVALLVDTAVRLCQSPKYV